MSNEWIRELKVGDVVIVRHHGLGSYDYAAKITRVTSAYVWTATSGYNRTTGRKRGSDAWTGSWLERATPECIADLRAKKMHRQLVGSMPDSPRWRDYTDDQLRRIKAILDESGAPERIEP